MNAGTEVSEDTLRGLLNTTRASSTGTEGIGEPFMTVYLEKLGEYMEDEATFQRYPRYHDKGVAPLPSR